MEYQDEVERMQARRRQQGQAQGKSRSQSQEQYSSRNQAQHRSQMEDSVVRRSVAQRRKARRRKKRLILLAELLVLILLVAGIGTFFLKKKESGFWTIAVFGVDSRDGKLESGNHSDVEMLCVLNRETGEIKLTSVYRDTYMQVSSEGKYHKINQAYFDGGHEQAVEALERNLDLTIADYATFNWKAVADAITILGGIDIEISDSEFKYINGFITETVESTGLGSHHLEQPGLNHLDGVQAVAYARLRLMDTDYNRTARQRLVISKAMEKAKQADVKTLITVVNTVMSEISTSIGIDDVLPLAKHVSKYYIGETNGFPFSRGETNIGKKDCVVPLTLESNVIQLHQFLYNDMEYTPSSTVKQISAKIASDSGMGQVAENAPEVHVGGSSSSGSSGNPSGSAAGSSSSENTETAAPATENAAQETETSVPGDETAVPEDETGLSEAEADVSEDETITDVEDEGNGAESEAADSEADAGSEEEGPGLSPSEDRGPDHGAGPSDEANGPGRPSEGTNGPGRPSEGTNGPGGPSEETNGPGAPSAE